MSKNTSSTSIPSDTEEDSCSRERVSSPLQEQTAWQTKQKSEAQRLQQDTISTLNLDSDILNTGARLLRSQRTILSVDEEVDIRQQLERDRIVDEEISFRPLRAGQTTTQQHCPTREDFEYIYRHIDDVDCQVWASDLEPWLHFIKKYNVTADPSSPILDKEGNEHPDLTFSLDTLLAIPTNKKFLKKT